MERHFLAAGCLEPGKTMMCSTAALQLNVNAGPAESWSTRVSRLHQLGPIFVAISACSPWIAGETSGWKSMRQQVWGEIDQARCGPLLGGTRPDDEWATYALMAPVMLCRDPMTGEVEPVADRVGFEDWVTGAVDLGRRPTTDDLDYHLSTLFPPVRLRGFLEVRCIDAVPQQWWPGLAGIAATLMDDPVAADRVAEICAPLTDAWTVAARDGLHHPSLHRAARECVAVALERAPLLLKPQMTAYAELVDSGRTPGDEIAERCERDGALATLEALAREVESDA
jgi:glutamate--cysteine ligase